MDLSWDEGPLMNHLSPRFCWEQAVWELAVVTIGCDFSLSLPWLEHQLTHHPGISYVVLSGPGGTWLDRTPERGPIVARGPVSPHSGNPGYGNISQVLIRALERREEDPSGKLDQTAEVQKS